MKKTLLAILATVAMVACSNDEIVREAAPEAIGFDNAFVNNSTRSVNDPSYSNTNLFKNFAVYGFVEDAVLFKGTKVAKDGSVSNGELKQDWKYAGTQYWIAGANYDFYAVAPFNGNWTIKTGTTPASTGAQISFTNVDGTQDLLYSGIVERQGVANNNAAVAFTFKHILSRVKFSFENGYNASAATIRVRDIEITNAFKTGEATLAVDNATTTDVDETVVWDNQADGASDFVISFGSATGLESTTDVKEAAVAEYAFGKTVESHSERLLIPGSKEWNISFVVDLLVSGEVIKAYSHTAKATIALKPGMSYDIKAVITAENIDPNHAQEPIEFTATMTDWTDATTENNATVDTIQQGNQNN